MILTAPVRSYSPTFRSFRSFDRAFAQLAALTPPSFGPAVTGGWVDGAYQLTVDLPGVADDAVHVSVAGRTLTIDVASTSSWSRTLRLPQTLDPEQVSARYLNGRLTVTIAKVAEPEVRRVEIDTTPIAETPAQPVLEAAADEAPADAENGEATSVTE